MTNRWCRPSISHPSSTPRRPPPPTFLCVTRGLLPLRPSIKALLSGGGSGGGAVKQRGQLKLAPDAPQQPPIGGGEGWGGGVGHLPNQASAANQNAQHSATRDGLYGLKILSQ